ncbi:hypothetical protein SDC9_167961 [bioreactor metagenome]|uniref:Uncharacterized protein n=1 Tax=bioreactor metagenome TaxID=1076179 RepID=A0A645G3Q8_9ZZZZ
MGAVFESYIPDFGDLWAQGVHSVLELAIAHLLFPIRFHDRFAIDEGVHRYGQVPRPRQHFAAEASVKGYGCIFIPWIVNVFVPPALPGCPAPWARPVNRIDILIQSSDVLHPEGITAYHVDV